jgi:hypothetical protein
MPLSRERLARNQVIFREVNARLRTIADAVPDGHADYLCECSSVHCTEKIELRLLEYESVRARENTFFIVPGHERLEVEDVIDQNERFAVVQKIVPVAGTTERQLAAGAETWPSDEL